MSDGLTFNGVHSSDFPVMITSVTRPLFPEIKDTYVEIPHKDGSILIPDKSKRDVFVRVSFVVSETQNMSLMEHARNIGNWLHTEDREPLIFDDDPNYIYGAKVSVNITLEQIVRHGRFDVEFRCLPYSTGE